MLHVDAGLNLKLGRLTPAERCAWVLGVLAIAAKSPVRGAFMVGQLAGSAEDVALQAGVPKATAEAMLRKVRALGMLERDDDLGAEWVHDFEEHNPEPKRDTTAAQRAKRYRDRQKAQRHGVTGRDDTPASRRDGARDHGGVTPPEVEEEEKDTPLPPEGEWPAPPIPPNGHRGRDVADYRAAVARYADWLLPDVDGAGRAELVKAALSFARRDGNNTNEHVRAIALQLNNGSGLGAAA